MSYSLINYILQLMTTNTKCSILKNMSNLDSIISVNGTSSHSVSQAQNLHVIFDPSASHFHI